MARRAGQTILALGFVYSRKWRGKGPGFQKGIEIKRSPGFRAH